MKMRRDGFVLFLLVVAGAILFPDRAGDLAGRAADRFSDVVGHVFAATSDVVRRVLTRF